ncbi:MAG: hypothetical protein L6R37_007807 [Teloschistes peruensis]|nr:MAG: hypothetical protein L6R37_007807 [Teloschistes peruensis]
MHFALIPALLSLAPLTIALPTVSNPSLPHPIPLFPLRPRNETNLAAGTPVSRAGLVLNPEAAAEANPRDDTATRAFTSVNIKTASGECLTIDPTAGDFRQNLIPVALKACSGDVGQKWDVLTQAKHLEQGVGAALVVSGATQGCLNFDPRRAANDQVILFSCGGRADGEGLATNSQEFAFTAGKTSLALTPLNAKDTCFVPDGAKLGTAACSGDAAQVFTIG